jgi:hypothetical protein
MVTKIMKCVSILALCLAAFRLPTANFQVLLEFVICVTALLVVSQAVRLRSYLWAAGFSAIAVLFNPIAPVALSRRTWLWLDWICFIAFLVSLAAPKRQPRLSEPSMANPTAGRQSL